MKKIITLAALTLAFFVGAKEYSKKDQENIENQYQRALKSYENDRDAAIAIRTLGNYFSGDNLLEKLTAAYSDARVNGNTDKFVQLRGFQKKMGEYAKKIAFGSVYQSCKNAGSTVSLLWLNFISYYSQQTSQNLNAYLQAEKEYLNHRYECKQQINAPKPKREDFKPLAII